MSPTFRIQPLSQLLGERIPKGERYVLHPTGQVLPDKGSAYKECLMLSYVSHFNSGTRTCVEAGVKKPKPNP